VISFRDDQIETKTMGEQSPIIDGHVKLRDGKKVSIKNRFL
jgi:hypothetical protein